MEMILEMKMKWISSLPRSERVIIEHLRSSKVEPVHLWPRIALRAESVERSVHESSLLTARPLLA